MQDSLAAEILELMRGELAVDSELGFGLLWFACELNIFVFYFLVFYFVDLFIFLFFYESLSNAFHASRIHSHAPMLTSFG